MDAKKSDNLHNDPLDQFFRERMSDTEATVPMGDWPAVETRVRGYFEKKRKRRFIIFFFFLFLLAGGGYLFSVGFPDLSGSEAGHPEKGNQANVTNKTIQHAVPLKDDIAKGNERQDVAQGIPATETGLPSNGDLSTVRKSTTPAIKVLSRGNPSGRSKTTGTRSPLRKTNVKTPAKKGPLQTAPVSSAENETESVVIVPVEDTSSASEVAASKPAKPGTRVKTRATPQVPAEEQSAEEKFSWVDVHAGANFTSPMLSGKVGEPGYFTKRRQEETGAIRVAYGVSFFYKVNRIIGSFGANIISFGEKVDYSDVATKRFQRMNGSQMIEYDSTVVSQTYVAAKNNRMNYVEFPLYVGYQFPTKGKLGVSVMGGLSMAFLVSSSNTYLDTLLTRAIAFENTKNESFRQQVFSVSLLPSIEYRMRSASEIYIAFPVRYHLSSVMHKDSGVKQRYLSPGIQVGYRFFMKSQ